MREEDILTAALLEDACLSIEELARLAAVSPEWVAERIEEGLVEAAGASAAEWRFSSVVLTRVQRMRSLERDFDAAPELAALVADLLEELDRTRRGSGGGR
jgi:chaperone modulatory protein CbpM